MNILRKLGSISVHAGTFKVHTKRTVLFSEGKNSLVVKAVSTNTINAACYRIFYTWDISGLSRQFNIASDAGTPTQIAVHLFLISTTFKKCCLFESRQFIITIIITKS